MTSTASSAKRQTDKKSNVSQFPKSKSRTRVLSNGDTYIDLDPRDLGEEEKEAIDNDPAPHTVGRSLPNIFTHNKQLRDLTEEVLSALKGANTPKPLLFVQSDALVVVHVDEKGDASLRQLDLDGLRGVIARAANFYEKTSKGIRGVNPPIEMVRDIASLRSWQGFPAIKAIVSTAIIRPDGSVLDTVGYDEATQLYYQPAMGLNVEPVSEYPTKEDVQKALETIGDIVHDFPYVSEADRANAYAAMLTPYIRMLVGCVPLALFEAPKQGTGKSLHAEIISLIQTGSDAEMTPIPTSEEEWTKRLRALCVMGLA